MGTTLSIHNLVPGVCAQSIYVEYVSRERDRRATHGAAAAAKKNVVNSLFEQT